MTVRAKALNASFRSSHWPFHQSAQYHVAVRSKTLNASFRSNHWSFHQSAQYHMAVRSKALNASFRSNHWSLHQSAQYHMVVRSKACDERGGAWSSVRDSLLTTKNLTHLSICCCYAFLVRVHVFRSSGLAQNYLARHGEMGKKTKQTE